MTNDDHESWERYRAEIDHRLDDIRPPRVAAGEKDWREPVYGWARNHIPDERNIVRHFAIDIVDRREGIATKRANRYLRQWAHGMLPLVWSDLGPLPIKVGKLRIRFDEATADEVEDAAREIAANGKQIYDEIVLLAQAMQDLARTARRAGLATVAEIGDLAARGDADDDADADADPFTDDDDEDF